MALSATARIALCALLPIAAIGELAAGEWQHRKVPTLDAWRSAAAAAVSAKRPDDMIIVAPRWAEPIGRMAIGDVTRKSPVGPPSTAVDWHMAGRVDLETIARVFELSIRGKHDPDVKGWKVVEEKRFGDVTLRTLDNPAPQKLVRDLVSEVDQTAQVSRIGKDGSVEACRWEENGSQMMPGLGTNPEPPPNRWLCSPWDAGWSFVGASVQTDLAYFPRRCIIMHPTENTTTTLAFPPKPVGKRVVGYVGLHAFHERELKYAPVHARVSVAGKEIAHVTHKDGDGWVRFEGSTADVAGTAQPVKIETWVEGSNAFRLMCVAAQLRD